MRGLWEGLLIFRRGGWGGGIIVWCGKRGSRRQIIGVCQQILSLDIFGNLSDSVTSDRVSKLVDLLNFTQSHWKGWFLLFRDLFLRRDWAGMLWMAQADILILRWWLVSGVSHHSSSWEVCILVVLWVIPPCLTFLIKCTPLIAICVVLSWMNRFLMFSLISNQLW